MGTHKRRSVSAQTYQKFPQLVKVPIFDVEDSAYGMIRFENGGSLLFEVFWAANLTDDIPMGRNGSRELFSTIVYGPKGSIRIVDDQLSEQAEKGPSLSFFEDRDGKLERVHLYDGAVRRGFRP